MDRLFLDANVLFSAAYRKDASVRELWKLDGAGTADILTSPYAVEEARKNLGEGHQEEELGRLMSSISVSQKVARRKDYPGLEGIELPDKDWPILLAALASGATHLITGDRKHFGEYFGEALAGVLVMRPADYLRQA